MSTTLRDHLQILVAGEAGQGIQTLGLLLARALRDGGLHLFAVHEFMSRIRGGSNALTLRIATTPKRAINGPIDCCVLLDRAAAHRQRHHLQGNAMVLGDPAQLGDIAGVTPLPLQALAQQAGGAVYENSLLCGVLLRLFGWEIDMLHAPLTRSFAGDRLEKNQEAARLGWEAAADLGARLALPRIPAVPHRLLLDGSQAVALGAVAGGCNFISSYPMSPATGVLIHLAQLAADHGIVVEQAEDEISAINMGLGAWYAGARALVSTSGGGFDLMAEGLSLCGIIESPLVLHVAQRPGPGTGLPTRTEQGDLEVARYSGHGEFPRALLAPASGEEAFDCVRHAFTMADASQSPVLVLTDQYLMDSLTDLDPLPLPEAPPLAHVVATPPDYARYALGGPDGLSPRGIPGFGRGLVCVDSDEHDAEGRITEDFAIRVAMVDKRLAKLTLLRTTLAIPPRLHGPQEYRCLLVGWGSTEPALVEALALERPAKIAFLHCTQVYPLPDATLAYLQRAERIIVVENNASGQFARLLRAETGIGIADQWLKYNGCAFTVDELTTLLRKEAVQ